MLSVIGLGLSRNDLTQTHLALIQAADVLSGGARHLDLFPLFSGEKIEIKKNLDTLPGLFLDKLAQGKNIVVLASGDPLFFGIAQYLADRIGKDRIKIYPNISAVAAAFARIKESWQDARVLSFHGRAFEHRHLGDFRTNDKLAVFTDPVHTPARICTILRENKITDFQICVLERLGSRDETLTWFEPGHPVEKDFSEPNLVVFLRKKNDPAHSAVPVFPGMPDDLFVHEQGLITKPEIRVISLSKLMLQPDHILWDLGAGSGAVSIEASHYITGGMIYAVEKKESRIQDIHTNMKTFGVKNLTVCKGLLPEEINNLPDPDRVFIGGGGKDLPSIIRAAGARIRENGIMVINTVLISNMTASLDMLSSMGFDTRIIQVQVNTGHKMPWGQMLKSRNPVFIIQGIKQVRTKQEKNRCSDIR
jgi:precorrin-6B C5,15-methyltransferase / cobalt-precorrin-6B C5,C15-methyltransferase